MTQEWFKNGEVFEFEMNRFYSMIENRDKILLSEGYIPVFNLFNLSYDNTNKNGTLILENDVCAPQYLIDLQNEIKAHNNAKTPIHKQITSLHPNHVTIIKEHLQKREIKNILIDSLFNDIKQFRFLVENVFSFFTEVNFFINSRGTLINTLNKEVTENMDKYKVRNHFYTHQDGTEYFNDLTFTIIKNNIYEMDIVDGKIDTLRKFEFITGHNQHHVAYENTYKYMHDKYNVNSEDIAHTSTKSKWE